MDFDLIPANLRVPGTFIEVNNDLANTASINHKMIAVGQKIDSGSASTGELLRVSSPSEAGRMFGRGSMLARMCQIMLENNTYTELWAVALEDGAGQKATASITFAGNASHNGTMRLSIAGEPVNIPVSQGTTPATLVSNIVATVNAKAELMATAAAGNAGQVVLTAKNAGETGNDLTLNTSFIAAVAPSAPSITASDFAGGTANPSIAPFITALGDEWFNWIACPYTDTDNLRLLVPELEDRWGPMVQKPARAFIAYKGTHAAASTFGNSQNSHLMVCMPTNEVSQPAFLWAAATCAASAGQLANNPARHLKGVPLKGLLPPSPTRRWKDSERNVHLWDGLSTYTVTQSGEVLLERVITMYQTNESGLPDDSYLDITLLETQDRVRWEQRKHLGQVFARFGLAEDASGVAPGVSVTDPKRIKGELGALYQTLFIPNGWCEDYEGYMASLIVEIPADNPTRVNFRDVPNYTNPLYTIAGKQQFIK